MKRAFRRWLIALTARPWRWFWAGFDDAGARLQPLHRRGRLTWRTRFDLVSPQPTPSALLERVAALDPRRLDDVERDARRTLLDSPGRLASGALFRPLAATAGRGAEVATLIVERRGARTVALHVLSVRPVRDRPGCRTVE